MPINLDIKKEYNKKYYELNKQQIAEKLYTKEKCENCGRVVSHQNMQKHIKSKLCIGKSSIDILIDRIDRLEKMVNKLIAFANANTSTSPHTSSSSDEGPDDDDCDNDSVYE